MIPGMPSHRRRTSRDNKEPAKNTKEIQETVNQLSNAHFYYNDEALKYRVLTLLTKFAVKHGVVPSRCKLRTPMSTSQGPEGVFNEYQKDDVRIRALNQSNGGQELSSEYIMEMIRSTHLSHENIIRFDDIFEVNSQITVSSLNITKNLNQYVRSTAGPHDHFIDGILRGLSYLHNLRIVHNDLNDQNILISKDKAMIANFGTYVQVTIAPGSDPAGAKTTCNFAAPEILDRTVSGPTRACNIWSFGGLCYELLSGNIPYEGYSESDIKKCLQEEEHPERVNIVDHKKWHLIETRCWAWNPDERPDCETISRIIELWQQDPDNELAGEPGTTNGSAVRNGVENVGPSAMKPQSGDPFLDSVEEQFKNENPTEGGSQREHPLLRMFAKFGKRRSRGAQPHSYQHARLNLRNINNVVPVVKVEDLTEKDVVIVAMGPTGAGKSTFIQTVAGQLFNNHEVGHQLRSATSEVSALRFTFTDTPGTNLVLVDTPGFDDTYKSDLDILKTIARWLEQVGSGSTHKVSGILYLHRITDPRVTGTVVKNFEMFQKLCGKNFFPQVVLATTMWPEEVEHYDECRNRDVDLRNNFWQIMIDLGSKVFPFWRTMDSAEQIVNAIIDAEFVNRMLQIQEEMVREEKKISRTQAGRHLHGILEELVSRQSGILAKLQEELIKSAGQDARVVRALLDELRQVQKEKDKAMKDMQKLD